VKPAGAVEVGRRVFVCAPTIRHRDEFLALMRSSRAALRPWVEPPASRAAFVAYPRRTRRPTERAFLVCRSRDGAIAGVIIVSQIFHGNFRSAYLGLHRLEANVQPGNRASIRLVRRGGFRREGFSPHYLKIFGRWRDHERCAITAEARQR